jgi:integrase
MKQSNRSQTANKPKKPHPDFPLFPHATKRWAKKIRGRFHFFGPWRDPEGALAEWLRVKDYLLAGREPPAPDAPDIPEPAGMTVETVVNAFLTHKELLRDSGEIQPRTFIELRATGIRIAEVFGKHRLVSDLGTDDFALLRSKLAKTRGATALGNEIQRVRSYFRWAYDDGLIDKPVRFGSAFKKPSAKTIRIERAKIGSRDLGAAEIQTLMDAANIPMKAMILLGVNCGLGNNDVALLESSHIDFKNGWIDYPRPKTGVQRRAKIWPETIEAIKKAIARRPKPKNPDDAKLVFVTKMGNSWSKETAGNNPVSLMFKKVLQEKELYRAGIGFYSLRRTFETVAAETLDQPAIDLVMGHVPHANDMGARYRQRISDDRVLKVCEHVRTWVIVHGSGTDAFSRRTTSIFHGRDKTPKRRLSVKMGLSPSLAREQLPDVVVPDRKSGSKEDCQEGREEETMSFGISLTI